MPLRIVLIGLPRLLAGIVRVLVDAHDEFTVVADYPPSTAIEAALRESPADVVVLGGRPEDPADLGRCLETQPRLRALAVDGDGRRALVYELRPTVRVIGELSSETLVETLLGRERWGSILGAL